MRDSLSVLDQLIAGSGPDGLTYESAAALLGFTDGELLDAAIDAFAAGDAARCSARSTRSSRPGSTRGASSRTSSSGCATSSSSRPSPTAPAQVLRHVPEDQLERMRRQSAAFGPGALSRAADVVNAGLTEMTGATAPRLQLELIAARILLPGAAGEAGYAARLDRLERRLDVGGVPTAAVSYAAPVAARCAPAPPVTTAPQRRPRRRPRCSRPPPPRRRSTPSAEHEPPARRMTPRPSTTPASVAASPAPPASDATREPTPAAPSRRPSRPRPPEPAPVAHPKGPGGLDTDALRRSWPDVLEWLSRNKRVTWTFVVAERPGRSTTTASGCCSASRPSGWPRRSAAAPTPTTCARP